MGPATKRAFRKITENLKCTFLESVFSIDNLANFLTNFNPLSRKYFQVNFKYLVVLIHYSSFYL